jgi:hypothetical protein
MHHSRQRRLRPASIVPLVSLIILLGTAAWAEVMPVVAPSAPSVSEAVVTSLSQPSASSGETAGLRTDLVTAHRHELLVRRRARTAWQRHHASAEAAPVTAPPAAPSSTASTTRVASTGANWYAIAQCESSGVWSANTGNGYWGGLQFAPSTWFAYGGGPFDGAGPFPYSSGAQIAVAERVLAAQGPGAWPNCFVWG